MRGLFARVYLGMLLVVSLGMLASWAIVRAGYDREIRVSDRAYIELIHPRIVKELTQAPREEWRRILDWWGGVSEYELEVIARDDPFWGDHEHLTRPSGDELAIEVYTDPRRESIWAAWAVSGTDEILYYAYAADSSPLYLMASGLGYAVVFVALAGAIYLRLRPITRSAQDLTSAAEVFADGRLDARVEVEGTGPLARLSHQFNSMAEEIQQRILQQEVMTSAISHELKLPLTRLSLALDMARAAHDHAKLREMLAEMGDDLEDLNELTDELLTLARLAHTDGPLDLQPVVVKRILDRLVPKLSGLEPRVEISVEGEAEARCLGHEQYLNRALSNLLANGQRHARSAVKVGIAVEDDAVLVLVEDDGDGIPVNRRDEIFMPFARVDRSRSRDTGGFGLGLSIVKQSLEVQGGSIQVGESEMGGARFEVRLAKA